MTKTPGSKTNKYEVGYRRPPKANQFQPGTSGNPRGRRKGSRSVGAVLQSILSQKLTVAERGRTRRVTRLEIMLLQLVEDAGAGISLVQELRSKVSGIIAVKPDRDKVSRMAVVSSKFEAGQVFLPERAPWLAGFEAELFAFPGSRNDDQCDSVSQALSDENVRFPMSISPEAVTRMSQPVPGIRSSYFHSGRGYKW
jgi:predicted phage terminase large subunit-like protein